MTNGFVKEPAVVTRKNFDASQFTPAQLERIKLEDGIRLHETTGTKVKLRLLGVRDYGSFQSNDRSRPPGNETPGQAGRQHQPAEEGQRERDGFGDG